MHPWMRQNATVHFTDYDTQLAAYRVIVDEGRRVLLALWNEVKPPQWTMPRGGVELAETVEKAVVPEFERRLVMKYASAGLLGVHSNVVPPEARGSGSRPLKSVRIVFAATVVGGELTRELDGTTDEARWFHLTDVVGLDRVPIVDIALQMHHAALVP